MSAVKPIAAFPPAVLDENLVSGLDARTLEILHRRRTRGMRRGRGWLIRRALLAADLCGLSLAFLASTILFPPDSLATDRVALVSELLVFAATLPLWVVAAKLYGLYDHDEERTDHSTADEVTGVLNLVTVGSWLLLAGAWVTNVADPSPQRMISFWGLAILLICLGRVSARTACRHSLTYIQNTIIVGAGDVGQLIARKLLQHPEYGINLVGFVDDRPKERRNGLEHLTILGPPEHLPAIVRRLDVERVVIAFSNDSHERTLRITRALSDFDVQLDVVPRLFEIVGPKVGIHSVEGLPLVGLPPVRLSRSSRAIKRTVDIVGALVGLVVTAPLFAVIAWRIHHDSAGPIFFRQTRLGMNMKEFTALKFRTMYVDADDAPHRAFVKATMSSSATPPTNGIYKLDRPDAVTPFGRWLRRTSLDELPQLINVLRGDMSLVGPRPCIPYETENFKDYHFERFFVPAGLTGLWQVTARAHSTFGEALDMDVAYARGWSLGLDLRLILRTPLQMVRQRGTA